MSNFGSKIAAYHQLLLENPGDSAQQVGWKDVASQHLRFEVLADVLPSEREFSLLDVGCGTGALLAYLRERNFPVRHYRGIDLCAASLNQATAIFSEDQGQAEFQHRSLEDETTQFDWVVSSGILNLKLDADETGWKQHVLDVVDQQFALCRQGAAFNVLSSHVDFNAPELFYCDPSWMFKHCKTGITPWVRMRHDYPLWEFTMTLWRDPQDGSG